jgi:AcrR family transcriptional regulator
MREQQQNVRTERTRRELRSAFASLVHVNRYEDLEIAAIAARAGVSRSTFYAHYASKDALLADSIRFPFSLLADTIQSEFSEARLVAVLEHVWENRTLARSIFGGTARRKATGVLIDLVQIRLKVAVRECRGSTILPVRLLSIQLAEILLAPVISWLNNESRCSAVALGAGLRRVSRAAMESMIRTGHCAHQR